MATINFEGLGKVSKGAITPGQLTILVGKNNTGKSYAASLLWALSNLSTTLGRYETSAPQWWTAFVERASHEGAAELEITADLQAELVAHLNKALDAHTSQILAETFAYNGFEQTKVNVAATHAPEPFTLTIRTLQVGETDNPTELIRGTLSYSGQRAVLSMSYPPFTDAKRRIAERFFYEAIGHAAWGPEWSTFRSGIYIPAARTGLMIAFRALVAQYFSTEDSHQQSITLPRPLSEFLQRLTFGRSSTVGHGAELADWVEKNILHGAVSATDDEIPTFSFRSDYHNADVPLHATSSMITELAPFLLALRSSPRKQSFIIFEEPEAHLHLSAQRDVARAIARLVNGGTQVLITTHSDTFIQQINNLLALGSSNENANNAQPLGYETADLLDTQKVKTYEFDEDNGSSTVREIEAGNAGFAIDSLNETIIALTKETLSLVTDFDD